MDVPVSSIQYPVSDFFRAGGTLPPGIPSYVERPADTELLERVLAGDLCYVLTPRQMGKSSLMARTARRCRALGVKTAIVDLTDIGVGVTVEQWYLGVLDVIAQALDVETLLLDYWATHAHLGYPQRFNGFLRDVLLREGPERIVIFLDEIDSTLRLDFRDDFFAAIRALYNARANTPELHRLTFVFLGVASPADLIKDATRTPFNVGHGIALDEFSRSDAVVLEKGLDDVYPGMGAVLLDRIFVWTAGHPYLTQKLCIELVQRGDVQDAKQVDVLVQTLFLADEARNEANLKFVQDRVLDNDALRSDRLRLYRAALRGKQIPDEVQSPVHNQLKLYGLLKAEDGSLRVRNRIYARAFDRAWVRSHLPTNVRTVVTAVAVLLAIVAIGLIAYSGWANSRRDAWYREFNQTSVSEERLHRLAKLYTLRNPLNPVGYGRDAHDLYFGLPSRDAQLGLFRDDHLDNDDLTAVVQQLCVTLADVRDDDANTALLIVMRDALPDAAPLRAELAAWIEGRAMYRQREYEQALVQYDAALARAPGDRRPLNPAILYERARVHIGLAQASPQQQIASDHYTEALNDLDSAMSLALQTREKETPVPSPTPTVLFTPTPRVTPSAIITTTVTATPKASPAATVTVSARLTPTVLPKLTLTPSLTPEVTAMPEKPSVDFGEGDLPSAFVTYFGDLAQRRNAVQALIYDNLDLAMALMRSAENEYTNLRESGLVLTPTPTAMPTRTSTVTPTPRLGATPVPSRTPTITFTPRPGATATPTLTPLPTATAIRQNLETPPLVGKLGDIWTRPIDSMVVVYVPAGEFLMGSTDEQLQYAMELCITDGVAKSDCEGYYIGEQPAHTVALDAFWMDRTEVAVAQFGRFVAATGYRTEAEQEGWGWVVSVDEGGWQQVEGADWQHPDGPDSEAQESHPVVQVSWNDALAYCQWAGGQLPTEAQWEYAARGPENSIYPWGDEFDGARVNFCDWTCELSGANQAYKDEYARTAPVGSFPDGASWVGALDMAGNVWEWAMDWYGPYPSERQVNPTGPEQGDGRVLRGGGWLSDRRNVRSANRRWYSPTYWDDSVGFRCVGVSVQGQ